MDQGIDAVRREAAEQVHALCTLVNVLGALAAGGGDEEIAGVVMALAVMRQTADTLLERVPALVGGVLPEFHGNGDHVEALRYDMARRTLAAGLVISRVGKNILALDDDAVLESAARGLGDLERIEAILRTEIADCTGQHDPDVQRYLDS